MNQVEDLIKNIKHLLSKDIFMPYDFVTRINQALPNLPQDKLIDLLMILQDSSSKKEEFLTKLFYKDENLNFDYQRFLTKQFNTSADE
jgi:hypothetical protein